MTDSDTLLLKRFCKTRDPEAFSEIITLYAGVVYGACMRIVNDSDLAADVAQETFFQLLRNAGKVTGSLAGWLHTVATRRAIDLVRKDSARKARELEYSGTKLTHADTWEDVSPVVDEALGQIDDQLRQVLVKHYLEGLTTHQVAESLGCSQATVSRRISAGLTSLRSVLKKRGIVIAAISLSSLMAQNAVQAAPAVLVTELGKMSLASAATTTLATAIKVKVIAAVAIATIGIGTGTVVTYKNITRQKSPEIPISKTTKAPENQTQNTPTDVSAKDKEKTATNPSGGSASGGWRAAGGMRVAVKPQPADPNQQAKPPQTNARRSFGGSQPRGRGMMGRGMMGGGMMGGRTSSGYSPDATGNPSRSQ